MRIPIRWSFDTTERIIREKLWNHSYKNSDDDAKKRLSLILIVKLLPYSIQVYPASNISKFRKGKKFGRKKLAVKSKKLEKLRQLN
jgi:hypothetical protein